ncbi:hypothetical protein [Escherichia coli]|uniref:hypothetical protein n=1 Tax=Escherichia coli TaxID=562 RepID=UPI003C6D9930
MRILPWIERYQGSATFTPMHLVSHLDHMFVDPARQEKARRKVYTMRQGKRPLAEFLAEFNQVLMEAGGHTWDDSAKKGALQMALNTKLLEYLIGTDTPDTYEAYCALLRRTDDRVKETQSVAQARRKGGYYLGAVEPVPLGPALEPEADAMDVDATSPRQPAQRAKWVSEATRQARRENGQCIRCGDSGHFISRCPYLPPRRPQTLKDSLKE